MHTVGRVSEAVDQQPWELHGLQTGLRRAELAGAASGSVHTQLDRYVLDPGGHVRSHCHSFEEAVYILEGQVALRLDGASWALGPADFVLVPVGMPHAFANTSSDDVRWLSISTPRRMTADEPRRDTFALDGDTWDPGRAVAIAPGDPRSRYVGHYEGTPPQQEVLRLDDPARGRRPAGRDTALVVYSGISVKMLVDHTLGAALLTMFTVDYEPGGSAQVHDHPFEEAYYFLDGEIEAELDGQAYTIRAGDVVWTGVGSTHGFFNTGEGRVRWIETQAPQPPGRHSYRWSEPWRRLEEAGHDARGGGHG